MRKVLKTLDMLALALTEHKHKWTEKERKNYEESVDFLKNFGLNNLKKVVKVEREGCANGTWQVVISRIPDWNLYAVEVAVLDLFGRKKNKVKL